MAFQILPPSYTFGTVRFFLVQDPNLMYLLLFIILKLNLFFLKPFGFDFEIPNDILKKNQCYL